MCIVWQFVKFRASLTHKMKGNVQIIQRNDDISNYYEMIVICHFCLKKCKGNLFLLYFVLNFILQMTKIHLSNT